VCELAWAVGLFFSHVFADYGMSVAERLKNRPVPPAWVPHSRRRDGGFHVGAADSWARMKKVYPARGMPLSEAWLARFVRGSLMLA